MVFTKSITIELCKILEVLQYNWFDIEFLLTFEFFFCYLKCYICVELMNIIDNNTSMKLMHNQFETKMV